jgi:transposase
VQFCGYKKNKHICETLYLFAPMLIQMNMSGDEIRELNYKIFKENNPQIQKRLLAVYLKVFFSISNGDLAKVLYAHRNSIDTWIRIYREQGIGELMILHYRPRKSELKAYAEEIKETCSSPLIRSVKEFAHKIEEQTGIKRGLTQVRKFIRAIGFKYLQTGHIPAKADPVKQREWKENVLDKAIKEAGEGKCHLFFCDAAHFVLAPFICKAWSLARRFVKAAAGRNRINVLGAVHAITKQVTTLINTTYIDAGTVMTFLCQLREIYLDRPVKIVLDNARYQHCKAVMELAESLDMELLFLPAYSPNLNIIERLWKFTKKQILYGQYYDSAQKFQEVIRTFFEEVSTKYAADLNELLTLKFQFFENSNAQNLSA